MELRDRRQGSLGVPRKAGTPRRGVGGSSETIAEHLEGLDRFLRRYRSLSAQDREDLCQDAYLQLLDYEERGQEVRNVAGLLRTIASRAAINRITRSREAATDPSDQVFEGACPKADPLRTFEDRLDVAWLAEALDGLSERERAVYQARWLAELDPKEACRDLGISRASYFRHLRSATGKVAAVMGSESRSGADQARFLRRYVEGTASAVERRRAIRLIRSDPAVAAEARELAAMHRSAAAVLPLGVLLGGGSGGFAGVLQWLATKLDLVGEGSAGATAASGAGGASGALTGLGASKVAALCAGGIALCAGGIAVVERGDSGGEERERPARAVSGSRAPATPEQLFDRISPTTDAVPASTGADDVRTSSDHGSSSGEPQKRKVGGGADPASVAPVVAPDTASEEFDPLPTAPAPAPAPAPAAPAPSSPPPRSSGGSSSGGGTEGAVAGSEFGP